MTGQRQLCSSTALQEPEAGSPSTEAFLWGLSWAISSSSLWPSPHGGVGLVPKWPGRTCPSPWPPLPCGMRHGPGVAQKSPQVSCSSVSPPSKHPPECSCGAEFWGTFTRIRHSWGRGCHPKEKGFSVFPSPQETVNLHLNKLLQVPPAALALCSSHSRSNEVEGNAWVPFSETRTGSLGRKPHPHLHPHPDLCTSLMTKSLLVWPARP